MAGLRKFRISGELLLGMFTAGKHRGYSVVHDAIPADAVVEGVRSGFDGPDAIEVLISSETLEPIDPIPFITPHLTLLD